jgi:hypothetical protein
MDESQADVQFRIEFFEFYVLLERVLLSLINAVGLKVARDGGNGVQSRGRSPAKSPSKAMRTDSRDTGISSGARGDGLIGDSRNFPTITTTAREDLLNGANTSRFSNDRNHAFHANLLTTLSQPHGNPLYDTLGTGRANGYLALAKDLRNGWKTVAADSSTSNGRGRSRSPSKKQSFVDGHQHSAKINNPEGGQAPDSDDEEAARLQSRLKRRYADLLQELKLDEMLREILIAVEAAGYVAAQVVEQSQRLRGGEQLVGQGHDRKASMEMVDAMYVDEYHGAGHGHHVQDGPLESRGMEMGMGWGGDEMEF